MASKAKRRGQAGRSAGQDRRRVDETRRRTQVRGHLDPRDCRRPGVTLADFRDAFPSKGAVLAGFSRRIDRAVLAQDSDELADESPRERLFDMLMRRLEAMAPYREGLREVTAWLGASRRGAGDEPGRARIDAIHARGGGHRVETAPPERSSSGPCAGLGAHRRRLARRRGSGPVEDHGRTRPGVDPRRAGGRQRGPAQRSRVAVPGAGAGRLRRPAPRCAIARSAAVGSGKSAIWRDPRTKCRPSEPPGRAIREGKQDLAERSKLSDRLDPSVATPNLTVSRSTFGGS